jgi:chemotaxis protein MotB
MALKRTHTLKGDSQGHDEGGDDEIWLISYADMMTLLFGFFVLMYAFAMARTGSQVETVKEGVARSFGGSYVAPLKDVTAKVKDLVVHEPTLQDVAVEKLKDGMEITFQSALVFESGSATLNQKALEPISRIVRLIAGNVGKADVIIEGHTDDVPTRGVFPSNWELSSSRASAVVREFVKYGFDPKRLSAVGYADSRPLYPNMDQNDVPIPENRSRNRRVVIKVVADGYIPGPSSH